jgi:hypothetical protein
MWNHLVSSASGIGVVVGALYTCLSTFWAVKKHLECRKLRRKIAGAAASETLRRAGGKPRS